MLDFDRSVRDELSDAHDAVDLFLLDRFALARGEQHLTASPGSQRLLAFLALHRHGVRRDYAAGTLWPDVTEHQAHANLRSALRRLSHTAQIVRAAGPDIALAPVVAVDFADATAIADQLIMAAASPGPEFMTNAISMLSSELLPGWYDDWVLLEAERWRQLRLHALEAVARLLTAAGRFAEAVEAAAAAVHVDPLRETARAAVIRAHLAEGNQSEALREFERYRRRLSSELGLTPTAALQALIPTAPDR